MNHEKSLEKTKRDFALQLFVGVRRFLVFMQVEFEVKRALEWLQADRHMARRHAAVLVLKELAR